MRALLLCLCALLLGLPASAQSVADFYRGKTVHVLIGVAPGGDYDVQARLFAKYAGRYIPGAPTVLAENMTGAGGLSMTNYLFNVAPKDGTYLGIIANNFPALQAVGGPGVQFDAARFTWLGAQTPETNSMTVWHTIGVRSVEEARRSEVIAGASARGAITYTFPAMMNELLGTRFKIVTGYSGGNDINLAMERGEVGARINAWASWKVTRPDWLRDGKIVIIAQGGPRSPDLPTVPSVEDLARSPEDRRVIEVLMLGAHLGRPLAAPPGVPAERVAVLRAAHAAAMQDADLRAEAANAKMEIAPIAGAAMQERIGELLKIPRGLADRARDFLQ